MYDALGGGGGQGQGVKGPGSTSVELVRISRLSLSHLLSHVTDGPCTLFTSVAGRVVHRFDLYVLVCTQLNPAFSALFNLGHFEFICVCRGAVAAAREGDIS